MESTSTATVANSIPTAASASADMYGMAVLDACEQITARLAEHARCSFLTRIASTPQC